MLQSISKIMEEPMKAANRLNEQKDELKNPTFFPEVDVKKELLYAILEELHKIEDAIEKQTDCLREVLVPPKQRG